MFWLTICLIWAAAMCLLVLGFLFVNRGNVITNCGFEINDLREAGIRDARDIGRLKTALALSQSKVMDLEEKVRDSDESWAKGFVKFN